MYALRNSKTYIQGSLVYAYKEACCSGIVGNLVFTYNTILVPGVTFLLSLKEKGVTVVKASQIRKSRSSSGESFSLVRGSDLSHLPYRITCGSETREMPCFIFYIAHLKQVFCLLV